MGHLLGLRLLLRLHVAGFPAIVVVGGATAVVGDPSGRMSERMALAPEHVQANAAKLTTMVQSAALAPPLLPVKASTIDKQAFNVCFGLARANGTVAMLLMQGCSLALLLGTVKPARRSTGSVNSNSKRCRWCSITASGWSV